MKIPILNSVEQALEHAKFDDDEVSDQLHSLLTELDADLLQAGYEAGTAVEQAAARLDTATGDADQREDEEKQEEELREKDG